MLYLLYKIGIFLALTLPLKLSYWLADILGSLYYLLARRDRKIARENIKRVLQTSDNTPRVKEVTRKVFMNFACYLVEFFRTPKIDLKYLEKYATIEGKKNLDQALSLGKGVLLVGAHAGNWELGAILLSMLGYKINVIVWTHKNKRINQFFLQQRQSKGVSVIPLGISIKKVFSALQNQEIVALLGDIDYTAPYQGITVKFFGQDTILPKGPAVFSLRTSAPIIPTFMFREKDNNFRLILQEPLSYKNTADHQADLTNLTQLLAQAIQRHIAQYPEQWFMLTPLWPA